MHEKTIVIGNINQMAKLMLTRNTQRLIRSVFDKNFRGMMINDMCKERQVLLGS